MKRFRRRGPGRSLRLLPLVLLLAAPAWAEPSPEEVDRARTFFNAGAQAYSGGKYADAVRSFEQAYTLAPRPTVLFSLAQAERKDFLERGDAGSLRHAVAHYAEYLDKVPTGGRRPEALEAKAELEVRLARLDPKDTGASTVARKPRVTVFSPTPGAQVSVDGGAASELPYFADLEPGKHKVRVFGDGYFDAEQEISGDKKIDVPVNLALREKPALVTIALATEAEVFVDGRLVAETPLPRPLEVPSGPHVIAIAKNGRKAWSQEVALERAKALTIEPKLTTSTQRYGAYAMIGVGGAAMIASGIVAVSALRAEGRVRDVEEKGARQNLTPNELSQHNDNIDRRDDRRTAALVLGGTGLGVLAGGLLFYVFDRPPVALVPPRTEQTPKPAPADFASIRPVPVLGPGLYGASLSASF